MAPHATSSLETSGLDRRRSSSGYPIAPSPTKFKFPELSQEQLQTVVDDDEYETYTRGPSPEPLMNGLPQGMHSSARWPGRRESVARSSWGNGAAGGGPRRPRQKSLSEAIHTIRTRKMSMSENAHEIAESLKAPISIRLIVLCAVWYATSILTNTSSKAILTGFPKPQTLTIVQFLLVSSWCLFLSWLAKHNARIREAVPVLRNGIRKPSRDIIMATLPLTGFQVGGHILNSYGMQRIAVSLVHTIKGLSPLMTVFAYRVFFDIRYSTPIYLSLIPLTVGVILACSTSFKGNFLGLLFAFGSAILFVTQNIVSKQIFNDSAQAEADGTPIGRRKPDKLNLLCYSSGLAFLIMCPIWLWFEGFSIAADFLQDGSIDLRERPGALDHGRLALEFLFNGTFHFGQSLVAFVLLGMVSPVTYSVASLIKRVVVILFAIIWFGSSMTRLQAFGFGLTFIGLYLYDRTSDSGKADKRARDKGENSQPLLPVNLGDTKKNDRPSFAGGSGYALNGSGGMPSGPRSGTPQSNGTSGYMLPGTKAQETWNAGDGTWRQSSGVR